MVGWHIAIDGQRGRFNGSFSVGMCDAGAPRGGDYTRTATTSSQLRGTYWMPNSLKV